MPSTVLSARGTMVNKIDKVLLKWSIQSSRGEKWQANQQTVTEEDKQDDEGESNGGNKSRKGHQGELLWGGALWAEAERLRMKQHVKSWGRAFRCDLVQEWSKAPRRASCGAWVCLVALGEKVRGRWRPTSQLNILVLLLSKKDVAYDGVFEVG